MKLFRCSPIVFFFVLSTIVSSLSAQDGERNFVVKIADQQTVYVFDESFGWGQVQADDLELRLWRVPEKWGIDPSLSATELTPPAKEIKEMDGPVLELTAEQSLQPKTDDDWEPVFYVLGIKVKPNPYQYVRFNTKASAEALPTTWEKRRRHFQINSQVEIQGADQPGKTLPLTLEEKRPASSQVVKHTAQAKFPDRQSARNTGRLDVDLQDSSVQSDRAKLTFSGFKTVFGQTVDASQDFTLDAPPSGKDDARYYARVFHEASRGFRPGFGIDLKIQPELWWLGETDWVFRPRVMLDVARNISSSANNIRLGADFQRDQLLGTGESAVQHIGWSLGGTFESDRDFEAANLLAEFQIGPSFRNWKNTREIQRIRKAIAGGVSVDEVCPPNRGHRFDLDFAVEAGSSLRDRTVGSSTNMLEIPRYGIFRLAPKFSGTIEYKRLTLNLSTVFRFLLTDERRAMEVQRQNEEDKIVTVLELVETSGFRPFSESSLTFRLDDYGRVGLSLTFQNGSAPPLYQHINKISSGIEIKY